MDNVISGFHQLMNVDHIAWSDGPGWFLALVTAWIMAGTIAAVWSRT